MKPRYTASAIFEGPTGGPLVFAAAPSAALTLTLMPFFRGAKGDKGDKGDRGDPAPTTEPELMAQISVDAGNQLTQGSDQRLFVAPSFTVAARFAEIAENPTAQDQARQNLGLLTIDGGTFN